MRSYRGDGAIISFPPDRINPNVAVVKVELQRFFVLSKQTIYLEALRGTLLSVPSFFAIIYCKQFYNCRLVQNLNCLCNFRLITTSSAMWHHHQWGAARRGHLPSGALAALYTRSPHRTYQFDFFCIIHYRHEVNHAQTMMPNSDAAREAAPNLPPTI